MASRASRTLRLWAPTRRRTNRSNQSDCASSTRRSTVMPSSETSMARTSSATSHTRPSTASRSTTVARNCGIRHGAIRPVAGSIVHRSPPTPRPHRLMRSTRLATAWSPTPCASGVRERNPPSSYSAHQRTTTVCLSRRTVPTTDTGGVASGSKLPSTELIAKRLRSAGSHEARKSATSEVGTLSARPRGKPSSAASPSMRAAAAPPSRSSRPASRSILGRASTWSPLRATTRTSSPSSPQVTSISASHVACESTKGSRASADAKSSTPARTRRVSHA